MACQNNVLGTQNSFLCYLRGVFKVMFFRYFETTIEYKCNHFFPFIFGLLLLMQDTPHTTRVDHPQELGPHLQWLSSLGRQTQLRKLLFRPFSFCPHFMHINAFKLSSPTLSRVLAFAILQRLGCNFRYQHRWLSASSGLCASHATDTASVFLGGAERLWDPCQLICPLGESSPKASPAPLPAPFLSPPF